MFAVIAAAVIAAGPSPTPSASPTPLPEIARVVTSDRGSESAARAARTTYVVTAADIARNGDRTIADAIAGVPGVEIQRYGAFGADATLGIRGSSPQQVLVLLDGLPIAGAQIENVNLEQLPVAGVERVEVVEGGGSTLYGSGSIGGVINVITNGRAPESATLSTGSFGEQTYQLQTPYVSFQRTYAANDYPLPGGGGSRTNADAGLTAGALTYSHAFGRLDASFLADVSDAALGAPGPIPYVSPTSRQDTIARDLRLTLEKKSARSIFSLALGDSTQDVTFACDTPADANCPNAYDTPGAPGPSSTAPPYAQFVDDGKTMLAASDSVGGERSRVIYGIDLSRGNARVDGGTGSACTSYSGCGESAYRDAIVDDAYAQTAAYVQSQWFLGNGGEIYAGLRGERDLNQQATAQGGALSPSVGGIVPLGEGWQLKLNAATAFRAPTAEELFYPPQGVYSNPGLVPERTRVGDATFVERSHLGVLSVGWFTTSGSNLIVDANPAQYDYEPQNIGRASIQGVTLAFDSAAHAGLGETASVTNLYRAEDLETGQRIVGRGPVFAATLGLRYAAPRESRFDSLGVTLTSNGLAEPANATLPWYAQASAFTTVDAYVAYRVAPKLALALRGYNLLGDRYAVFNGYPMPGPSWALELRSR